MAKAKTAVEEVVGDQGVADVQTEVAGQTPAFIGSKDGVAVYEVENGGYQVAFSFDRKLMSMMHTIPGAAHNKEQSDKAAQIYDVPAESLQKLGMVVAGIRQEHGAIEADRAEIMLLAKDTAAGLQRDNGTVGVQPKVDDYIERATADKPGRFYSGEIVNANARFAAQLTGFGDKDGVAFVKIHRQADLDKPLEKGSRAGIEYGVNGRGSVSDLGKTMDQRIADFQATAGKNVDGVTVTERGDKLGIKFDINPGMIARIKRIEGAAFNKEDSVWEVGADKAEFVLRAVEDMRGMHVKDQKDIAALTSVANDKLDGAKVIPAFTKDGVSHTGKIAATLGNYVMQSGGQGQYKLHHKDMLDMKDLQPEQNVKILYGKQGLAKVTDLDLEKAKGQALAGQGR